MARSRSTSFVRRRLSAVVATLLATSAVIALSSSPSVADTSPPAGVAATVSADRLPTVQIDGVAWAQVTVGNTVYVTGSFAQARPAGAAAGTNQTARANLLAYNITTGALITSFNHSLNGQGLAIAASPDGSRVYVGGQFTTVDGQTRNRVAAFDTATGALVSGFAANLNSTVRTITATNATVYLGGDFSTAQGSARTQLAAYTSAGALTTWAPVVNASVTAMTLAANNTRVVVGGRFTTLNGAGLVGIGAVSPGGTGANTTWNPAFPIQNYGSDSSYTSLVSDGTNVYGTAYQFGMTGNFEGRFAANPLTGNIVWLNSCHGDSYAAAVIGNVVYSAGHAHDCSDAEDFTQDVNNVFNSTHHYAMAESTNVVGQQRLPIFTGGAGIPGPRYASFPYQPHSAQLDWYPSMTQGTYTGQSQASWSVSGNSNYVSFGGEFPTVQGVGQQGLVRFAVRASAPNAVGPASLTALTPSVVSQTAGTARVAWRTTSDQDNETLTYRLFRDGGTTAISTSTVNSRFWNRPALTFTDTGLATGSTHTYRVTATDPTGNVRTSGTSAAVTIGSATLSTYNSRVRSDGAANFWPLSETSGTTAYDYAGGNDLTLGSGVTRNQAGPTVPGTARSSAFDGTANSLSTTRANGERRTAFSVEAWVRTTSTAGGEIAGYGVSDDEDSANTDRTLYLAPDGRVFFGVWTPNVNNTVNSTTAINNGAWHHVVGTVSSAGMQLYVDGARTAVRTDVTASSSVLAGFWRVGGDSLAGWASAPTGQGSGMLNASIADVAVYPTALSAAQVSAHFGAPVANVAPTARISTGCNNLACQVIGTESSDPDGTIASYAWDFGDGATATGATASHTYASAGSYTVTLTVTDDDGATGTATTLISPSLVTFASDSFQRTSTNGWGTADGGGVWTTGTSTNFAVAPGAGTIRMGTAGANVGTAYLGQTSARDVDVASTFAVDKVANGNGSTFYQLARRVSSTTLYRSAARVTSTGAVALAVSKFDGSSTEAAIASATVPGLTYTAGTKLRMRFQAVGASPTTLRVKVWRDGTTEPSVWQLTTTDSSAALQVAGSVGISAYLSASSTSAPVTISVSQFNAALAQ